MKKRTGNVDAFYAEMCDQLEDAADRGLFARFRRACPKMTEEEMEYLRRACAKTTTRIAARQELNLYLDLHDQWIAAGKVGMFDEWGNVNDKAGEFKAGE